MRARARVSALFPPWMIHPNTSGVPSIFTLRPPPPQYTPRPVARSVAARGPAGTSPCCPPVAAVTATEHDRRTQLALWVGGRGEIEFAMGNERGKGVILGAGQFEEGVWTHLAVSVEGRKVCCLCADVNRNPRNRATASWCLSFAARCLISLASRGTAISPVLLPCPGLTY